MGCCLRNNKLGTLAQHRWIGFFPPSLKSSQHPVRKSNLFLFFNLTKHDKAPHLGSSRGIETLKKIRTKPIKPKIYTSAWARVPREAACRPRRKCNRSRWCVVTSQSTDGPGAPQSAHDRELRFKMLEEGKKKKKKKRAWVRNSRCRYLQTRDGTGPALE